MKLWIIAYEKNIYFYPEYLDLRKKSSLQIHMISGNLDFKFQYSWNMDFKFMISGNY